MKTGEKQPLLSHNWDVEKRTQSCPWLCLWSCHVCSGSLGATTKKWAIINSPNVPESAQNYLDFFYWQVSFKNACEGAFSDRELKRTNLKKNRFSSLIISGFGPHRAFKLGSGSGLHNLRFRAWLVHCLLDKNKNKFIAKTEPGLVWTLKKSRP